MVDALADVLTSVCDGSYAAGIEALKADLTVHLGGRSFSVRGGANVECAERALSFPLLLTLVEAHERDPGAAVSSRAIAAALWPGEPFEPVVSMQRRVRVCVNRVRDLGARPLIEHATNGYRITPGTTIERR